MLYIVFLWDSAANDDDEAEEKANLNDERCRL